MYTSLYLALAAALFHYAVVLAIKHYQSWGALRKLSKEHNCEKPVVESPWDILGIVKIYASTRHLLRETALVNISDLFARYGDTYASRILSQRVYFTCDPRNIRHVLINRFSDFDGSDVRAHLFRPITAHGIFALDGEQWKAARGLYSDIFSHTRQIFDLGLQEAGFQGFLRHIPAGHAIDLQPLFLKLILDVNSAFAMGVCADTLSPNQSSSRKQLADSLMYAKRIMARDGFLGPPHYLLSRKDLYTACNNVKYFVDEVIRTEIASREHKKTDQQGSRLSERGPLSSPNLLQQILDNTSDVSQVRGAVVTILIAGTDSVASLLSTTFFLLARHERVFAKLRQEILDTVGTEPPTYESLRKITYLRYVFNEAMRVYPPVPFNARTANRDTWLPVGGGANGESGVLIHRGERVIFSSWGSHRSPKTFGDDSHEFRPERWEGLKPESLGYIPFSLGPRICLGQQYALLEASYATIRIIQTFRHIENRDVRPWTEKIGLNLSNKNGVLVELVPDNPVWGNGRAA